MSTETMVLFVLGIAFGVFLFYVAITIGTWAAEVLEKDGDKRTLVEHLRRQAAAMKLLLSRIW